MTEAPPITISHVVLHCFDIDPMIDFYKRVMGMRVTDQGKIDGPDYKGVRIVFLSNDPRDHHQLALTEGRTAERGSVLLHQVSYRHDSLARLRGLKDRLEAEGVTDITPANHGTHWSMYFHDPDGNRIEAFVDTPWYVAQPCWRDLDLSLSDDEIAQTTEAMFHDDPSFRPLEQWRGEFSQTGNSDAIN
ncbi:MAG: VOC family protein [Rhodospirillales bacterium]|nr:VOC family protein [Rhodospirillales bacterium]